MARPHGSRDRWGRCLMQEARPGARDAGAEGFTDKVETPPVYKNRDGLFNSGER